MNNILFIINPISGGIKKESFPDQVLRYLDLKKFKPQFLFTQGINHAYDLAKEAIHSQIDIIVAVGGDGTVNEVASALVGSEKAMAIVPCGSGNGLARSLNIPMDLKQAIELLNQGRIDRVDSGTMNGQKFFSIAGVGFDAHVSALFAKSETRGFWGYVKVGLSEVFSYKPAHYIIEIDGKKLERDAFMISVANGCQFGNSMYIAPLASVSDGLFDVCIVKPMAFYQLPLMGIHLFGKMAHRSQFVDIIKGKHIKISRNGSGMTHLDGEPKEMDAELEIILYPLSLRIIH